MALSNLHTNYKVSYKNDLINLTKLKENGSLLGGSLDNLNAQADKTANSIALGYGYDAFQHYDTITTDLAGLATSKQSGLSDIQAIQAVKDLIDTHRVKVGDNWQFKEGGGIKTLEDLRDKINLRITLSTEKNAETLMLKELNSMEMKVKAKTGLGESNELIALVDLAFNGGVGIIGSNLVNAINTDNRVAAWYEIRYNTNKNKDDGLQNRRKEQSDLFGLYSSIDGKTPVNDNEAKNVIRYLENKRISILTYLSKITHTDMSDLDNALSPAKNRLISNYAQGVTIDRSIVVGTGIGQTGSPESFADVTKDSSFDDTLNGTDKNDLMFGERGNDTIIGGKGRDVIYGGEGDDTIDSGDEDDIIYGGKNNDTIKAGKGKDILYAADGEGKGKEGEEGETNTLEGGEGEDLLYGSKGKDTLNGGNDNDKDILKGGEGYDTYKAYNNDVINDSDGKGQVYFEDTLLQGGEWDQEKGVYVGDGGEYSLNDKILQFIKDGKKVTIENYDQNEHSLDIYLGKRIQISIEDVKAYELEGVITFTIKIDRTLKQDFTLELLAMDGTATHNLDYRVSQDSTLALGTAVIKAGETEVQYSISIANDGIYEMREDFRLWAYYKKGTYKGDDIGPSNTGTAEGIILDLPSGGDCPPAIAHGFGNSFDIPQAPSTIGTSSGGGGSSYWGGSGGGGGSYYTPSVYTGSTYTPPVVLPHVPVYECHYDLTLFSVAVVSLPVACLPSTPPLVFDLNRDGVTSLSMAASLALFDYNADTIKEHTAWIQNGDALLVRDKNNDGLINDGSELFGDHTLKHDGTTASDGYDALSEYDTNCDGIIDVHDQRFTELKLWHDNGDGVTQIGELKTLTEENITSITLPNTTPTPILENGNTITNVSTYTQLDGTSGDVKDVWFTYENIATQTYFDTDGDGFSEKMDSWMGANQGVLVWDKNNDGLINSGKEVLGTNMLLPNGKKPNDSFSALNAFDTNNDGIINNNDTAGLAIWRDTNKNGITDAGELLHFGEENALTSINLNPFQNMLSGYDKNHDMKINSSDAIYNYMYHQENVA